MFKKLILIAIVLTALLITATAVLAATNFCDPPPTPGVARTIRITCYVDATSTATPEMGTKEQPFKDTNRAIAEARAHPYGGNVYDLKTGASRYYAYVRPPATGAPISGAALFALLVLVSLILVIAGRYLRRRAHTLANRT